jgi:hypothetical protein
MQAILANAQKAIGDRLRMIQHNTPESIKVRFLTFANTGYMKPTRIIQEASPFRFDSVHVMNEYSIPEFIEKHRGFIEENKHGYGIWIWKPKIILDTLLAMDDGDILIYCDAGMHLNIKGLDKYRSYMRKMEDCDILTFSLNDKYKAQHYVKRDVINAYYPAFAEEVTPYCYAGVMILKKTAATVGLVKDWLRLCENYHFLDSSASSVPELPIFQGQDGDNGLFNICLAKHSISKSIYPDETNIYDPNGFQLHSQRASDWNVLNQSPFQCRRMRPPKE